MSFPLAEMFFSSYRRDPNSNYLVSAPTGSGKTHLAKVVLLEGGGISIYVSPLKALSREVYLDVKDRTRAVIADSDVYEDDLRHFKGDVLLATYEKLDSAIRHDYSWLGNVKRVIIDEIHNVEGERSLAIENIVLWAKEKGVPLISLSATLSNPEKYVKWLDAKLISHKERTVPLHECIAYPYTLKCSNGIEENFKVKPTRNLPKLELLYNVLEKISSMGKNALVFVKSRKSAEILADKLNKMGLRTSFYHSGMSQEDRKKVLDLLYKGSLNAVVSTTALGQGVNLPVYAVVFYEMKLPLVDEKGEFKGWKDISRSEFLQIAGRAGRPKYDKEGLTILIASNKVFAEIYSRKYFRGTANPEVSRPDLDTLSLAFISWNQRVDFQKLKDSINSTFNFRGVDESEVERSVTSLREMKLLELRDHLSITPLGRAVAISYIDVKALKGFPIENKEQDLITAIVSSPEVAPSLRGCKEGKELLSKWMNGESIEGLCVKLSHKDIGEFISNSRWISFAMYRVMRALNDDRFRKALDIHLSIKYGVPVQGINLARAGIPREIIVDLLRFNVSDLTDLCVLVGLKGIREQMRKHDVEIEVICRKVYSDDPSIFDARMALQQYEGKEFELGELVSRYGRDTLAKLMRMKLLQRRGDRFVIVGTQRTV
ncbi:DEAD/DEAH box helicase [Metallosphaera tengchongensis]|uniref:DEAD/DEAH box helicase n=1 Tax=Metallosphaera tengchongensis TaxID=1532350 RepID=A0A6N0NSP6_9CREN|nr:DEAD/DEAH box helicase [Metallosphaera tengchongensis]QKQ99126.1 DEAD/DEAH box helicase [Metallosphaera tengchongensis]